MPALVPIAAGLGVGLVAGLINGALTAYGNIPAFIATLGMMVTARGLAQYYTHGQPVSMLSDQYTWIGSGSRPVLIFVAVAIVFYIALRYTKYGKYTYAIGGNGQAARGSGISVGRHLVVVYAIAGLLSGLGGVITSARAASGQAGMGMSYELDAIAAAVIGGISLSGLGGVITSARAASGQAGMGMSYELDAIAAAVIGGISLSGGVGRITGTVIGTLILGVMMSGFTFLGVDSYIQNIIKGVIIVAAVVVDQYRNRRRK